MTGETVMNADTIQGTEWFDEHKNDVSHMLWSLHQISTQLNIYVRFWTDVFDGGLQHHNQNTK